MSINTISMDMTQKYLNGNEVGPDRSVREIWVFRDWEFENDMLVCIRVWGLSKFFSMKSAVEIFQFFFQKIQHYKLFRIVCNEISTENVFRTFPNKINVHSRSTNFGGFSVFRRFHWGKNACPQGKFTVVFIAPL
jgi:hypothetical protein